MCTSGPASADGGTLESVGLVRRVDGDDWKMNNYTVWEASCTYVVETGSTQLLASL